MMDYKKAAAHWKEKDAESIKMDKEPLLAAMRKYIMANNTCSLATGIGDFIRCTPIEYAYYEDAFWLFTEGGEKFIGLEQNKNVCLAIYDKYSGFTCLKGMQITGVAELIEPHSEIYFNVAAYKKLPIESLKKMARPMYLIKVIPKKIEFLNADFKKEGFNSRQALVFN